MNKNYFKLYFIAPIIWSGQCYVARDVPVQSDYSFVFFWLFCILPYMGSFVLLLCAGDCSFYDITGKAEKIVVNENWEVHCKLKRYADILGQVTICAENRDITYMNGQIRRQKVFMVQNKMTYGSLANAASHGRKES